MNNAADLFKASHAAQAKLARNLRTCEFISLTRREADPFVAYADKLARFQREADEATAKWTAVASKLSTDEIVAIMSAGA